MQITPGYFLAPKFTTLITIIRRLAPPGLTETWGVSRYDGGADYRLTLGPYRVIGVFPLATELAVLVEVDKIFDQPELYESDPDYARLEDAYGYLVTRKNRLWILDEDADLNDPYVETFLSCGMRLMVKEIQRRHPNIK